jgi:hypothetical protein
MTVSNYSIPIIRTKLHRPPVAGDFVHREGLNRLLDESFDHPLTLVSAPAGYGKSTSVSHWIETRDCPCAWLTFDGTDSKVRVFLSYLVAAVQTVTQSTMSAWGSSFFGVSARTRTEARVRQHNCKWACATVSELSHTQWENGYDGLSTTHKVAR